MQFKRSSGILLHPTSLPGPNGIGELGQEAFSWIDWLSSAGSSLWQILPLGPTGYGDSPYQCFSAFAGNPYLISLNRLIESGLLHEDDLIGRPNFLPELVDFGKVYRWKLEVLDAAFDRFLNGNFPELEKSIREFQVNEAHWIDDFAAFMAIKEAHRGVEWSKWEPGLRARDPESLEKKLAAYANPVRKHIFRQYLFFKQWTAVREYAHKKGIRIIGDIPIFVAYDSADVWANPELFHLDPDGTLPVQAGVPPDYFSETGQLWGNPLYRWEHHRKTNFAWWIQRFQAILSQVDIVRLDHFRGFYDYWEIPGDDKTAINGRWVLAPGVEFLESLQTGLGVDPADEATALPIIAEDLGEINPKVYDLRDQFNLPGMKILVFAFGEEHPNLFLPHNYPQYSVVYTGTHDNDTVIGWYNRVGDGERDFARRYLGRDGHDISWDLIRAAWSSVAVFAIAPLQDFLNLGNEARMNVPGTLGGKNWAWRVKKPQLTDFVAARLKGYNKIYEREFKYFR